jgi:hypothetical protein
MSFSAFGNYSPDAANANETHKIQVKHFLCNWSIFSSSFSIFLCRRNLCLLEHEFMASHTQIFFLIKNNFLFNCNIVGKIPSIVHEQMEMKVQWVRSVLNGAICGSRWSENSFNYTMFQLRVVKTRRFIVVKSKTETTFPCRFAINFQTELSARAIFILNFLLYYTRE